MEKILNKNFRNSLTDILLEAGLKEKDAIKFVKGKYHKALKEVAINRIRQFLNYISNSEYDKAESMMYNYTDGTYLDFADIEGFQDIWDIIQELKNK